MQVDSGLYNTCHNLYLKEGRKELAKAEKQHE